MRILFVDDDSMGVQDFKQRAEDCLSAECRVITFGQTNAEIANFKPDILVLDLIQGQEDDEKSAGMCQLEKIWKERFCPVIVYSAFSGRFKDEAPEEIVGHPFIAVVQKGAGSDEKGCDCARDFAAHITALQAVDKEISRAIQDTLRDLAPFAFRTVEGEEKRSEFLVRAARRRVAAMMDVATDSASSLACWEHYVYPPCDPNLLLGDVIHRRSEGWDDPKAFRLVLTPSCDMVKRENKKPNVSYVLVARCNSAQQFVKTAGLVQANADRLKERLPSMLSRGYLESCLPLPPFQGKFPAMTADLRDLELVSLDRVGKEDEEYERVLSMDSPFRELVAWAYLQTCGRPGLPDRDVKAWSEEIIKEVNKAERGGQAT